jgi:Heparinase II/III-like protein
MGGPAKPEAVRRACFSGFIRSKFTRVRANPNDNNLRSWPDEQWLRQAVLALRRGATEIGFQAFPQLARAALAMEAARFAACGSPEFFSRHLREIPPTLNEDLLDLYGRSGQVLANQFAFHNISETLNADFDWEKHPSAAWRRELHSFDYALTLAMTYRISQETHYAIHLRYLIAHWIARNLPGRGSGWQLAPMARRVRNWVLASSLVSTAWQDDWEFQNLFAQSLALQCAFLNRHSAEADSLSCSLHCAHALLLSSKFFAGAAGKELSENGRRLLAGACEAVFDHQEVQNLPRPTECFELAAACLENVVFVSSAGEHATPSDIETTRKVLETLEGTLAPDGTLPLFGPSARSKVDELSDLFALATVILGEPRWKGLAGKFGIFPYLVLGESGKLQFDEMAHEAWSGGSRAVPEPGLYRLAGRDRSALIVNARPSSSPEEHQDFLSYELYVQGSRLVVDSGAYSPDGETGDRYFASARAHNILLIDGQSSCRGRTARDTRESILLPLQSANAPIGRVGNPSSPHESLESISLHDTGFDSIGFHHQRAFFCLDGAAWAVLDWLQGEGPYEVRSLIHFFPTFEIEARPDCAIARSRALKATVIPLSFPLVPKTEMPALRVSRGPDANFPGFYSPDAGVRFATSVLSVVVSVIQLPWIGGYLIIPGSEVSFRARESDASQGSLSFEVSGKLFRLKMS